MVTMFFVRTEYNRNSPISEQLILKSRVKVNNNLHERKGRGPSAPFQSAITQPKFPLLRGDVRWQDPPPPRLPLR